MVHIPRPERDIDTSYETNTDAVLESNEGKSKQGLEVRETRVAIGPRSRTCTYHPKSLIYRSRTTRIAILSLSLLSLWAKRGHAHTGQQNGVRSPSNRVRARGPCPLMHAWTPSRATLIETHEDARRRAPFVASPHVYVYIFRRVKRACASAPRPSPSAFRASYLFTRTDSLVFRPMFTRIDPRRLLSL